MHVYTNIRYILIEPYANIYLSLRNAVQAIDISFYIQAFRTSFIRKIFSTLESIT